MKITKAEYSICVNDDSGEEHLVVTCSRGQDGRYAISVVAIAVDRTTNFQCFNERATEIIAHTLIVSGVNAFTNKENERALLIYKIEQYFLDPDYAIDQYQKALARKAKRRK